MSTFEEWWVMRAQDGTENKDLARDAWFAGQKVVNDQWNAMDSIDEDLPLEIRLALIVSLL